MGFLTGQSWHVLKLGYTGRGPKQGFWRCIGFDEVISIITSSFFRKPNYLFIYNSIEYWLGFYETPFTIYDNQKYDNRYLLGQGAECGW